MAKREIDISTAQWLDGDESAFKRVVDHYYHQLHAFAFQMVRNPEDTEELVMNAFLKLWQHKHRITYVSRPDEYLFGILRREIAGHARKRVVTVEPIEEVALTELGTVEHPELTLQEIRATYRNALAKLTPRQRAVFQMSREQELTQQEIAGQTGLSVNTIGNHMNAALRVLREEMKECPGSLLIVLLSSPAAGIFLG